MAFGIIELVVLVIAFTAIVLFRKIGQPAAVTVPKAHSGRETVRRPKIEAYVWSVIGDESTCPACKKKDGQEWKRKRDADKPPHPECTSAEGCRCELMPVYDDEGVVTLE